MLGSGKAGTREYGVWLPRMQIKEAGRDGMYTVCAEGHRCAAEGLRVLKWHTSRHDYQLTAICQRASDLDRRKVHALI